MLYLHVVFGENKAPTFAALEPYSLQIQHEDTACQGANSMKVLLLGLVKLRNF